MSGRADTIRPTIRHDRMRVLDTWGHPSSCPGCAAEKALDALLTENQRLTEELTTSYLRREADGLIAENQRLRDALEQIATPSDLTVHSQGLRAYRIAREALAGDTRPVNVDDEGRVFDVPPALAGDGG